MSSPHEASSVAQCDCGAPLVARTAPTYDASALVGLKVVVEHLPCLQCDLCGGQLLRGEKIERIFYSMTLKILRKCRLNADEVRFLRKELRLTLAAAARKLGVSEQTIRSWESGRMRLTATAHEKLRRLVSVSMGA